MMTPKQSNKVTWFLVTPVTVLILTYFAFFNHIEPNQVGLARNHISGQTWLQKAGWHITAPWTWVAVVNTNPIRVGVPTAGRGYSSKLVQFVPEYYDEFLEQEGWRWYWWDNRISFNFGNYEEYRGFRNTILGYAYSKTEYPFIRIIAEYEERE